MLEPETAHAGRKLFKVPLRVFPFLSEWHCWVTNDGDNKHIPPVFIHTLGHFTSAERSAKLCSPLSAGCCSLTWNSQQENLSV